MNLREKPFYLGLFLLCMSTLLLQIVQTRILSVVAWYHLAFFSISMAMFGMTAGALWNYLRRERYATGSVGLILARTSLVYAISIVVCAGFEFASVLAIFSWATVLFVWAEMIILLASPFFFAGVAVSLALTRSPFPVGRVYGVDLAGAAAGCLAAILLLDLVDGPSALIAVAAIAAVAAIFFAAAHVSTADEHAAGVRRLTMRRGATLGILLVVACAANAATKYGFQPIASKGILDARENFDYEKWNSFSRIVSYAAKIREPFLWGASPLAPTDVKVEQHELNIDGSAGTTMSRYDGDPASLGYLDYDVTNVAYAIRHSGRAAVIGVGGGRDIMSAYHFGFRDITGVELNPIFVDLLDNPRHYRAFAGLADLPNTRLFVDDGRSWFARTKEHFDLIEMALVDTWAATGAGGFTLSENGLYTTEGWQTFLRSLTPTGVLTVSRWYSPEDENETGRVVSLAMGALFRMGVENPRDHIFLVGQRRLATIIVSRQPFSQQDIDGLRGAAEKYQHKILLSPGDPPANAMFADLMASQSFEDLEARGAGYPLDVSPPTDSRPFFFNMLRLQPQHILAALKSSSGVLRGNLVASGTVLLIIVMSTLLVMFTIVWPMRGTVRAVDRQLATAGTAYFMLIGLGFMLVEMGLIQRISVFLGHPVYGLAVGLFSIILATGIGSLLSEAFPLKTSRRVTAWAVLLFAYLAIWPAWFPMVAARFESAEIVTRALVSVMVVLPAGILMGFGFPTGMRLVNAIDSRPTPWFWGINGAAGVLASGLAVGCSISTSIDVTLRLGALAYLAIAPAGLMLLRRASPALPAAEMPSRPSVASA